MKPGTHINTLVARMLYPEYFKLSIHHRINARQHRNTLNINYLFPTTIRSHYRTGDEYTLYPRINNGLYHHTGKKHSMYSTDTRVSR
jgi:hypothetical protein